MSSTKFRFARTATGSLPGASLIQQTEDAINELAQKVIDHNLLAEETKEKAALALETVTTAQNTAAQALSKSEQAVETATAEQTQATTAVRDAEDAKQSAEDSMLAAQASASSAAASESAAESASDAAQDAASRAVSAQTSASAAQTNALSARQAAEAAQASADVAQANSLLAQSNAQAAQESAACLAQGGGRYDTAQSLSTSQKTRARTNIEAAPLQGAALTGQTSAQNLTVSGVLEGNLTGTADAASKLSTARSISVTGDASWLADFDGFEDVTSEIVLSPTGVTSGTYGEAIAKTLAFGGSLNVVSLTVDGKGRITSAKSVAMKMPAAPTSVTGNAGTATKLATVRTISATGDASWSVSFDGSGNASGTLTLANSGATAGSYGASANAALEAGGTFRVPYVTVDAKGRVTSIKHVTLTLPDAQTSVSGNAATATMLSSARTFAITGGATGSVSSDLSSGASIAVTLKAMTGATSSAAGAIGAVPAPAAGAQGKFLRGDGTWQTPPNTTYSNMGGASTDAAGKAGLVPAPAAGYQARFLRGDGTWATPPNTTYGVFKAATASAAGGTGLVPAPSAGRTTSIYVVMVRGVFPLRFLGTQVRRPNLLLPAQSP